MDDSESKSSLPNLITAARIAGSPVMVILAWLSQPIWLAGLTVLLVFTEWLDGFLARRLHATSPLGARLDTIADAVFYSCLLASIIVLRPDLIQRESVWIVLAVASYLCSWLVSWLKFRSLPSYHTWAAKGVWVLVGTGVVCLLADIAAWPFQAAMCCVAVTNLEAIAISCVLPTCKTDVPSIWHALRQN